MSAEDERLAETFEADLRGLGERIGTAPIPLIDQDTPFVLLGTGGLDEPLLSVHPDGTVEAKSIEDASEAGRIFVDAIRFRGMTYAERIARLEAALRTVRGVSKDIWDHIDALLREGEWQPSPTGGLVCSACGNFKHAGHAPDCRFKAVPGPPGAEP
jgi:hypothetical protein